MCPIDSAASQYTRPPRQGAYVAGTFGLLMLGMYAQAVPVFRDALQEHFRVGIAEFGLLLSIGMIPGALAAAGAGVLVDRWGPARTLRLSFVALAVGSSMVVAASAWVVMLAAMAVLGAAVQALFVAAQSYLVSLFPSSRRRVLSLCLVMVSLGGILFPLGVEVLLLARSAWGLPFAYALRGPFAVLAAVFVAGAILFRGDRARPSPPGAEGRSRWLSLPTSAGTWWLIGLMILHGMADSAIAPWLARVLGSSSYAHQTFAPGVVLSAYALAYVVSRTLLAMSRERSGVRVLLIVPGLLGGGLFLAGILSRSQGFTGAGYVLGAFCWSVEFPVMLALVADREHRRLGSVLAVCTLGQGLGSFLMTNLMGRLAAGLSETGLWMILLPPAVCFPLVGLGGLLYVVRFLGRSGVEARTGKA